MVALGTAVFLPIWTRHEDSPIQYGLQSENFPVELEGYVVLREIARAFPS